MDALLVTLARQGAIRDVTLAGSTMVNAPGELSDPNLSGQLNGQLNGPEIEPDSVPVAEAVERENVRAQSAVAMHQEPANRASSWIAPIWRFSAGVSAARTEGISGFETEVQTTSRLFGLAFLVVFSVTVAFLIWNQIVATPSEMAENGPAPARPELVEAPAPEAPPPPESASPSSSLGVYAFSGALREGVDPTLPVPEGKGVLEIGGSGDVRIEVDGVERGLLPISLVLAEGTHAVRYRNEAGFTDRFYFVKSGATRSLHVVTRPGGLVDPR
jgi:hypothetical protein